MCYELRDTPSLSLTTGSLQGTQLSRHVRSMKVNDERGLLLFLSMLILQQFEILTSSCCTLVLVRDEVLRCQQVLMFKYQ